MWWWEQEGMDLDGMRTAAREADHMEGQQEKDRTDNEADYQLSGEDTEINITLGKEPNAPLAYDPGLEIHYPIMGNLGERGGQ